MGTCLRGAAVNGGGDLNQSEQLSRLRGVIVVGGELQTNISDRVGEMWGRDAARDALQLCALCLPHTPSSNFLSRTGDMSLKSKGKDDGSLHSF